MTSEEKADLRTAITLIEGLRDDMNEGFNRLASHTEKTVTDAMILHVAKKHANDAEVVKDVRLLKGSYDSSGAFRRWCGDHWRALLLLLGGITAILEVLERTHII